MNSALFIVTNVESVNGIDAPIGFDVREAAHVWASLTTHRYRVTFASIRGGNAVGVLKGDRGPAIQRFVHAFPDDGTVPTVSVRSQVEYDHDLLYFVGGLGAMWDFPHNSEVHALIQSALLRGSTVAAICHGPAAFLGLTDGAGRPIVADRAVTAFTDAEERARGVLDKIPFSLEQALGAAGATFTGAADGVGHVVVDGPIITAQNPSSLPALNTALLATTPLIERNTA